MGTTKFLEESWFSPVHGADDIYRNFPKDKKDSGDKAVGILPIGKERDTESTN